MSSLPVVGVLALFERGQRTDGALVAWRMNSVSLISRMSISGRIPTS